MIIVGGEDNAKNFSSYLKPRMARIPYFVVSALNADSRTRISGIVEQPEHIGERAIELLAAMIQRGEKGIPEVPIATMVEGTWVDRGRIGCRGRGIASVRSPKKVRTAR
ncbi:MAG: hypothetical protein QM715_08215 [Nibricoccus sp.]